LVRGQNYEGTKETVEKKLASEVRGPQADVGRVNNLDGDEKIKCRFSKRMTEN